MTANPGAGNYGPPDPRPFWERHGVDISETDRPYIDMEQKLDAIRKACNDDFSAFLPKSRILAILDGTPKGASDG